MSPLRKISTKITELLSKKRELEIEINQLTQKRDAEEKLVTELALSITDLQKRSGFSPSEYIQVEQGHFERMEDLENTVVNLTSTKDLTESELITLNTSVASHQSRLETLRKEEKTTKAAKESASKELISVTKELNSKKQELASVNSTLQKEHVDLTKKINVARHELQSITGECDKRMKAVQEEERLLSIKRTDLGIYEARLRKKYPHENLVLT